MECRQRLYLTADRKKIVPKGDKKAASLYAVPGDEIPQETHDRFGLVDGHLKGFDPDAAIASEPEPKEPEPTVKCTQVLYLATDGKSVVEQGNADAGELYAKPGDLIPQSAHDLFGLVGGALPAPEPSKDGGPSPDKEQKGAPDKEQKDSPDKQSKDAANSGTQTGAGAGDGAEAGGTAQAGASGETV